jgi:glyoxylase-like metal-dependent hydrolase (beta-lactamase superfamily II)
MTFLPGTGERVTAPSLTTECHRGVMTISDPLPIQSFQPTMTYQPLRGDVWTISDGIYRTIAVEGRRSVVAFDTFYSPGAALSYRNALNRVFPDKPIETIVYSHDHLDHTGYALDLAPAANVIAHADCAAVVVARDADGQARPTQVWEGERWTLDVDGVEAQLIEPGATHGAGNVAALFADEGLLFMVDTVIPGVGYTFYPDYHVAGYTAAMRTLLEIPDWDLFVPGHFWPVDRAGFTANLDYCDALPAVAREALGAGVDPDRLDQVHAFAERRLGPDFGGLFRFQEYVGLNLMRFMLDAQSGGWGPEDNAPGRHRPPAGPRGPRTARPAPSPVACEQLAEGLWTVAAGDHRAAFVAGEDGVVALNSFGSPELAGAYREAIDAAALGLPIVAVVATIDHLDHSGCVADLAPEVVVIAHEDAAAVIAGRGAERQTVPQRLVAGTGATLSLGGAELRLIHLGPTVGSGNLAVHVPAQRALFMVGPRADARYGLFADAHLGRIPAAVRPLLDLDVDVVIPGRGPVMGRDELERALDYLDAIHEATQLAYTHGVAVWDVRAIHDFVRELLIGSYGDLGGFDEHIAAGALRFAHYYLMGGWGLEDGRPAAERAR